ncbi:hypothetical protein MUK42_29829 [Musa troglodytarum]|uniref:Uncharacterized protein n=1 Tax=Musa troglodytarum TaxID=320322 RepID=A0A9E7FJB8_9LILI|nr:hypothetical protein MUK42_29829 [Musa troglodytarum]
MEGIVMQGEATSVDKAGNIVLDIESLTQSSDKCSGSPKMTKVLSRKGSSRMERRNGEEQDADETTKKVTKVNASISDAGDGRLRKFNHLTAINPRRILLLLASFLTFLATWLYLDEPLGLNKQQLNPNHELSRRSVGLLTLLRSQRSAGICYQLTWNCDSTSQLLSQEMADMHI